MQKKEHCYLADRTGGCGHTYDDRHEGSGDSDCFSQYGDRKFFGNRVLVLGRAAKNVFV